MVALIRMNAGEGMYSKKFFLISQSLQKKLRTRLFIDSEKRHRQKLTQKRHSSGCRPGNWLAPGAILEGPATGLGLSY